MANIQVYKDHHSFYIVNLINTGEQIQYDWSLSQSYPVVIMAGEVSIGTDVISASTRKSLGLFKVPAGQKLTCSASAGAPAFTFCPFVLSNDTVMSELFPTGTTLTELKNSSSNLGSIEFSNVRQVVGHKMVYDSSPGNATITLPNLNTIVTGALSS